jgi:hypothetical protein
MESIYLAIPLSSLAGAVIAGFFGKQIGRGGAHWVTIMGVGISFLLSLVVLKDVAFDGAAVYNQSVYTWMVSDGIRFEVGFLIDGLTALMMSVVTGVSLAVHVYTIGYMHDDDGYQRFFSYISLFTFSMLMLVMSNNFLQLFFGWEAVGLVSYLLIGFWFKRETAIYANMKAFLVNRVGDFGFLLGIAVVLMFTGSLDYYEVFEVFDRADAMLDATMQVIPGVDWSVITLACILLFVGAMGKSAQVPLHVWLPDSMEGPTPISALIHAATMVTAGIFMVARMSPLFELSTTALSVVIVIGATTAFFMGLVGIVHRCHHGVFHGAGRYRAKRHQARGSLLDAIAAGLHDRRARRFGLLGGDIPPDDPRFLQGPAIPGRGLGHYRDAPRAGYPQDGWSKEIHADHLLGIVDRLPGVDRVPRILGILFQGRYFNRHPERGHSGCRLCLSLRPARRFRDCVLFLPYVFPGVSWLGAHG